MQVIWKFLPLYKRPDAKKPPFASIKNSPLWIPAQGVPEDMLLKAGTFGVCKINIDTDLRLAMTASVRKHLAEHPGDFDPRQYLKPARQAIQDMVAHKIRNVLNCSNRL